MKSYDKLRNRYEQFHKIYEALKRIRPRRLYKITEVLTVHGEVMSRDWFIGIMHACTQSAVKFHLVAIDHYLFVPPLSTTPASTIARQVTGYSVRLFRLGTFKIEQLKLADLPAYVSAPFKTTLYDKLLMRKVKILED